MLFSDEDDALPFRDRSEAGRILGAKLAPTYSGANILVLALPRGGAVVASEISHILRTPLKVFLVRKLKARDDPELALGAIAQGGTLVLDSTVVERLHISETEVHSAQVQAGQELAAMQACYAEHVCSSDLFGKCVILVDDGAAGGSTLRAAALALRKTNVARIVIAIPVAPLSVYYLLHKVADEVVCLAAPEPFFAISQWYEKFEQVPEEDVLTLLRKTKALAKAA